MDFVLLLRVFSLFLGLNRVIFCAFGTLLLAKVDWLTASVAKSMSWALLVGHSHKILGDFFIKTSDPTE